MSTTLSNARIELSKQLGDYWSSTFTTGGSATSNIDTALIAKTADWITDNAYDFIVDGSYANEERKITSLTAASGTLLVLAHTGVIATSTAYEIHRLFTPSEKRIALIAACRQSFPYLFKEIRDESKVSGNWLKDGSFEDWTTSTNLTYWTETTTTVTQTSTAGLFKHGAYSAALTTAAGNIAQTIANNDDLKKLAGKNVTFTVQGKCNTASCLRIGIYDGTTTTYSDYHDSTIGWTEDSDPLEVTATIQDHPSQVTFYIYHDVAAGTSYVDDARVIDNQNPRIYIGDLGLQRNTPHQVLREPTNYYEGEPWQLIHNWKVDSTNGFLYLPDYVPADLRLRILGLGYLDFLASGVSSTAWTATVSVDSPQLDILIANAIIYLYTQMSLPNFTSGDRKEYQKTVGYWQDKLADLVVRFGMTTPSVTINWSL